MTNRPRAKARTVPSSKETAPEVDTDSLVVIDAQDPLAAAALFRQSLYTSEEIATLHHQGGVFYGYTGSCYDELPEDRIRSELWHFAAQARQNVKGNLVPFKPNSSRVSNMLDAVRAASFLDPRFSAPCWLGRQKPADPDPGELAPVANGVLHVPSRKLLPPTPRLYSHHAFPIEYRSSTEQPEEWLNFLYTIFEDVESVEVLQEVMGYLLLPDTSQQKGFLIVGPKRSGKGTIGRVITALLGHDNVCAPTLGSLAGPFGLQPLIGKLLALVGDARLSGRADQVAITERILTVSGEDTITVERKHLPPWTGKLLTRFLLLTNELPRLADASGALASRFIVLTLKQSFYGREDSGLTKRLLAELPLIFDWALDGWERLTERGHFIQPQASASAVQEMEELGSPISAFVRDRCRLQPGVCVEMGRLYEAWRKWCEDEGRDFAGNSASFGRDLRAAFPDLSMSQPRVGGGKRVRIYEGICLDDELPLSTDRRPGT